MRRSSVIAAALVAGLAVAGQAVAAETQHRKLAQGIDEGSISYEVLVSAAENVLGDNFLGGGIDAGDFAGDVIGPLLAAPAAALGQGVEIILRPVYEVFQQVPGLGVCN